MQEIVWLTPVFAVCFLLGAFLWTLASVSQAADLLQGPSRARARLIRLAYSLACLLLGIAAVGLLAATVVSFLRSDA